MLLIVLLVSALTLTCQPNLKAETPNTTNYQLTFHGYSVILKDANNSLIVYDGADGSQPSGGGGKQADLVAQISGQRSGWNYWQAVAMWTFPLQQDMHVSGAVTITAYISSTYKFSGLLNGGGYGMGIVDIDENNKEVKQFITESDAFFGNPFSQTPTQYSLTSNVNYVFKKGHAIGFAVGVGGTEQGYTATVYFDSSEWNSGATLPVADTANTYTFTANYGGASHNVAVVSNSAVSSLQFDSATKTIQFKAQGIGYTNGYCDVSVPKTLMQSPFTVTQGAQTLASTLSENSTYTQLHFTHMRIADPIKITGTTPSTSANPTPTATSNPSGTPVPEFPMFAAIAVLAVVVLLAIFLKKKSAVRVTLNGHPVTST